MLDSWLADKPVIPGSKAIAASSAIGPCGRGERMTRWYSGSCLPTALRVCSVSAGRMPRSAWQNRMNARSSAGALLRYAGSGDDLARDPVGQQDLYRDRAPPQRVARSVIGADPQ
jgi:hypothetical protein